MKLGTSLGALLALIVVGVALVGLNEFNQLKAPLESGVLFAIIMIFVAFLCVGFITSALSSRSGGTPINLDSVFGGALALFVVVVSVYSLTRGPHTPISPSAANELGRFDPIFRFLNGFVAGSRSITAEFLGVEPEAPLARWLGASIGAVSGILTLWLTFRRRRHR